MRRVEAAPKSPAQRAPRARPAEPPEAPAGVMTTFQRILIAIDGGEPAARAAAVGCSLAQALGAEVCLFHAIEPPPLGEAEDPPDAPAGERFFAPLLAQLPHTVQIFEFTHVGEPTKSIPWAAWEWSADLVVIGSHGRDGVMRAFLGSVAEAVVRHAQCPVLVVRAKAEA